MDQIDLANQLAELDLQSNLAKSSKVTGPKATGFCLYCEEQLHTDAEVEMIDAGEYQGLGLRWCDADCRDWWEETRR